MRYYVAGSEVTDTQIHKMTTVTLVQAPRVNKCVAVDLPAGSVAAALYIELFIHEGTMSYKLE
jgi:hypothetical protein